jgi:hypothetical protein
MSQYGGTRAVRTGTLRTGSSVQSVQQPYMGCVPRTARTSLEQRFDVQLAGFAL